MRVAALLRPWAWLPLMVVAAWLVGGRVAAGLTAGATAPPARLVADSPLGARGQRGPAAPNESLVTGEVLQLEPIHSSVLHIAPPQILTRLRLRLLSVQEAESTLDALRGQEGATLEALAKEALDSKLVGKIIRGIVTYRGDERGGRYWIREIHEVPPN